MKKSRKHRVKVITKSDGSDQYRVSVSRTSQDNDFDTIDRNIPRSKKTSISWNSIIYWSFTTSIWKFALTSILFTLVLNVMFSFVIAAVVAGSPQCVSPSVERLPFSEKLWDSFHLSWTTFSTVGYGLISPATSAAKKNGNLCILLSFLLSFESLIGVLFVGFCAAILFGKITQFQGNAQIVFSSIISVTYGKGSNGEDEDEDTTISSGTNNTQSEIPCPVLRFKIANELHSMAKGEITDAVLHVVATIDAKNSILGIRSERVFNDALKLSTSTAILKKTKSEPAFDDNPPVSKNTSKKNQLYAMRQSYYGQLDAYQNEEYNIRISDTDMDISNHASMFRSAVKTSRSLFFQEETNIDKPNLVFAEVIVTPDVHPFFSSTWVVSHRLDANSPLLKKKYRKAVSMNNGFWPQNLNNMEEVRKSIHFDDLLISFKGNSGLSGREVYHQHLYTLDDLRVGVQFKSLLMQNLDGSIYVSCKDIDETRIQDGGISEDEEELDPKERNGCCTHENAIDLGASLPNKEALISQVDNSTMLMKEGPKIEQKGKASTHNKKEISLVLD